MTYRLFATWAVFFCFISCAAAQTVSYDQALDKVGQTLGMRLATSSQKTATVLDFTNLDGMATQLGRLVTQDLTDRLLTTAPSISWIDRSQRDFILKENKLAADKLMDPATRKQLGRLMGIDTIVVGTLTTLGKEMRLQARVIDIETARVLAVASTTFLIPDSMNSLADRSVSGGGAGEGVGDSSYNSVFRNQALLIRAKALSVKPFIYAGNNISTSVFTVATSVEIENVSGGDIWVGILSLGVGTCKINGFSDFNGLTFVHNDSYPDFQQVKNGSSEERRNQLTALPAGSKTVLIAQSDTCGRNGMISLSGKSAPFSVDLVLDIKGKFQRFSAGITEFPITSNTTVNQSGSAW